MRGVVLETGERVGSRWVFGADGARVDGRPPPGRTGPSAAAREMALLLAYWRGLPASGWCQIDVHEHAALMSTPCEDGLHLLSLAGPPETTRGERPCGAALREGLRQFPAVLNPRLLDQAEQIFPLVVVPETMMRGHYRRAAGPGWALVGDAGPLQASRDRPGHRGRRPAGGVRRRGRARRGRPGGYQEWRDSRAAEFYGWSFEVARFGTRRSAALYSGLAADPAAGGQFLDTFTKRTRPSEVVTRPAGRQWRAASAYDEARRPVRALVEDLQRNSWR